MKKPNEKKIIIVGGGVIGLSVALGLSRLGHECVVLDAKALQSDETTQPDKRVYAINDASRCLFESLNIWEAMSKTRVSPYEKMIVWDARSDGTLSFDCVELAKKQLGFIVEERVMRNALIQALSQCSNVLLNGHSTLQGLERKTDEIILQTDKRLFKGQLLIGADGANSWVKKQSEFETKQRAYHHHALVSTIQTEKPHGKTAWQIFTNQGPLAFLPLSDPHLCSIVYSSPKAYTDNLMGLTEPDFLKRVECDFESRLGRLVKTSDRTAFPLFERHTLNYVKPRIVLMGDALHTIHPLAGLGVNLGLKDVACFLACAEHATTELDHFRVLRQYERQRKGHNTMVIKGMAAIKALFSFGGLPAFYRGWGMNLLSQSPFIKNQIAQLAFMS